MNLSDRAHTYHAHGPGFNSRHPDQMSLISNGEERDFLEWQIAQEHHETFAVVLSFPPLVQSGTKGQNSKKKIWSEDQREILLVLLTGSYLENECNVKTGDADQFEHMLSQLLAVSSCSAPN